jgi:thiamine transport system substrate-binding protein
MSRPPTVRRAALLATAALVAASLAACSSSSGSAKPKTPSLSPTTITLMTHDFFATSNGLLESFTQRTGITVKVLKSGDAGRAVNQAILTKDHSLADVFYGIDNTFLSRALDAGIFVPYTSPELSQVPTQFQLDANHRVTPIDYGDVCINDDVSFFQARRLPAPRTIDDLADPQYKNQLVMENPADSSPGLAFMLATIARFGTNHWLDYWKRLKANGVKIVSSWDQAYSSEFSGSGAGHQAGGTRPLVVSYASSPPAEVVNVQPQPPRSPIGTLLDTCFRQVEFAGILRGTPHRAAAEALVDFMVSAPFQEDMPLNMFVFPVRRSTPLPDVFTRFAAIAPHPFQLPAGEIGRNRDAWIREWTNTVLR